MLPKFGYCVVSISPVRSEQKDASEMVTQLLFGELVSILELEAPWCKIKTYSDNYEGYVDHKQLHFLTEKEVNRWLDGLTVQQSFIRKIETPWGLQTIFRGSAIPFNQSDFNIGNDTFHLLKEKNNKTFESPYELALDYLNTPYLWGGKTPFGIDCSGLTQIIFRVFEINLPRDASQQAEHGVLVQFDEIEKNDLAFFANKNGKIIHVGILNGDGLIIHASGFVREDQCTIEGIINATTGELTHFLHSIKRMK